MRNKSYRVDLEQQKDGLAKAIRDQSIRQTIEAAEQLKQMTGESTDPFTERLLAEALEDFSRLPDYSEALFRRRAERIIRPRRRLTIVGRARRIAKFLLSPISIKRRKDNG